MSYRADRAKMRLSVRRWRHRVMSRRSSICRQQLSDARELFAPIRKAIADAMSDNYTRSICNGQASGLCYSRPVTSVNCRGR